MVVVVVVGGAVVVGGVVVVGATVLVVGDGSGAFGSVSSCGWVSSTGGAVAVVDAGSSMAGLASSSDEVEQPSVASVNNSSPTAAAPARSRRAACRPDAMLTPYGAVTCAILGATADDGAA